ncbi:Alpha-ketoglutarate-dependent dioxygenase alkB 7, mitochondrial [Liparis tanakae]|uniref:Alpha-ketoglutarate-dependent dioxygenase alkB 7, mitochondrial n=1 Tax=Liparis tanakae TaxID=230148 RepID=A0A4Z2IZQ1_9TELE|nr:Alpha-ketoglutarate-dependent dioxygenase alkB 7, mitochondrial [Liparis tanakae]
MKLLLTVFKQIHQPALRTSQRRCRSSCASSGGLSPLRDEALIVGSSRELVQRLGSQVEVRTGFITEEEEEAFLRELEPGLKKKRYEFDHWDDGGPLLGPVHVLDLDKTGYIKPHIDSVKFCGSTIAGLSLLSDSIMRLVKEDATDEWLDLLLPRLSLYILRDQARYDFTHQILRDEESVFNGQKVPRLRRVSVICRNLPG